MKRNKQLSIRCAQPTSLSRATSFNTTNVNMFFDNLARVMDREHFEAKDIYTLDETGITTVQKPDRIVAKKRNETALDFCKENGIVVLSFPPHCSHKLQPIDRAVYGPLKKAVNSACDSWMRNNPSKTMSIYDIPGILKIALPLALTQTNIQAAFRCTGIFPFNRDILTQLDFAPSSITDRPMRPPNTPPTGSLQPSTIVAHSSTSTAEPTTSRDHPSTIVVQPSTNTAQPSTSRDQPSTIVVQPSTNTAQPSTSRDQPSTIVVQPSTTPSHTFSPESVRPFLKAPPRKQKGKKRHSTIYTDTPQKERIRIEYKEKQKKRVKKNFGSRAKEKPKKATTSKISEIVFGIIEKTCSFLHTPKRWEVLSKKIDKFCPKSKKLHLMKLCPTRWVERPDPIMIFAQLLDAVCEALDEISNWTDRDASTGATGLINSIYTVKFMVSLFVSEFIFSNSILLSRYIQHHDLNLAVAVKHTRMLQDQLLDIRKNADAQYETFF
ncbi:hypothetical protein NQ314_005955 [Rhamnusium bicolor]|uniref:DDE-1 domain-containing protein n=1 Tax=Rhamnusium bicolor TaxID=1586634 RepID=A0AAV8ZB25_9CUCU|nr:hypothetical protein NQ314_005955 [Rhamnusium bicolor]